MIIPDDITTAAVALLNTNKATIGLETCGEIGEDKPLFLAPPYAAVYIDTVEETTEAIADGDVLRVPFDMNIIVKSSEQETNALASRQAWTIVFKIITTLLTTPVSISGTVIPLKLRKLPFQILEKKTHCIIQINFRFYLDEWE